MATQTETKLKLEAPEALQTIAPAEAAGLVPIEEGVKSKLETVVDKFVDELVAVDANSPEFGKKVDELTNMGRKQIAEAAGHSNRFLDRPIKAIDKDTGIGADLPSFAAPSRSSIRAGRAISARRARSSASSPGATSSAIISRSTRARRPTSRRSSNSLASRQGRAADGQ